ncbi:MAG: hypothetical protein NT126_00935 [Bacteroidetes bacterium]|nr:hypothetical protein [Bacteroidota bacterium]
METALLKYSLADVIRKLKEMLVKKGFLIEAIDEQKKELMVYRNGNWYRQPKHILFELSSIDNGLTRIDITASIDGKKRGREAEEVIEEKMASIIYTNL